MQTDGTDVTVLPEYIFGQNRSEKSIYSLVQVGGLFGTK